MLIFSLCLVLVEAGRQVNCASNSQTCLARNRVKKEKVDWNFHNFQIRPLILNIKVFFPF